MRTRLSAGSVHWCTRAVHRALVTREQRSAGNRSLEKAITETKGKYTERCLSSENMVESKAKQYSETKRNPRISAYRCSLGGSGRDIFPVNASERQLNSWSYSERLRNTTEYQNLKMKEKSLCNSKFSPSVSAHGCSLSRAQHWAWPIQTSELFAC